MMKVKDLKVGQEIYYIDELWDVTYCNFDYVLNTKPCIVKELVKDKYTEVETYRMILKDGDYCFSISTWKTCDSLFATKEDLIKKYIHACNEYIRPVYEQMQLAKKYLEENEE